MGIYKQDKMCLKSENFESFEENIIPDSFV
jgi:hypothetical protein